jgi:hypothetical protein
METAAPGVMPPLHDRLTVESNSNGRDPPCPSNTQASVSVLWATFGRSAGDVRSRSDKVQATSGEPRVSGDGTHFCQVSGCHLTSHTPSPTSLLATPQRTCPSGRCGRPFPPPGFCLIPSASCCPRLLFFAFRPPPLPLYFHFLPPIFQQTYCC